MPDMNCNAGDLPTADRSRDLTRVFERAIECSGDATKAQAWLDMPLAEYRGLTPRELVAAGRADTVLLHIGQLESGSSG